MWTDLFAIIPITAIVLAGGMLSAYVMPTEPIGATTNTVTMEILGQDVDIPYCEGGISLPTYRLGPEPQMSTMLAEDCAVRQIGDAIHEIFPDTNTWQKVLLVQKVVHENIHYESDPNFYDNWQAPWETVMLGHGDCEDMAILVGAVLRYMGVDVALVFEQQHVSLGVVCPTDGYTLNHDGKTYQTLECTKFSWPGRYAAEARVIVEPGMGTYQILDILFWMASIIAMAVLTLIVWRSARGKT